MKELEKYFHDFSELQILQFKKLFKLYKKLNKRVNVISRKDIDNLYTHHFLHSLSVVKFIRFKSDSRILDIGTGGGLPGLPLAIFFPKVNFLLVDSISKKIVVAQEIVDSLNLRNVKCKCIRVEQLNEKFDFAVARAVASLPKLKSWLKGKISSQNTHKIKNGLIALKGGDLTEELKRIQDFQILELERFFLELYFKEKKLVYLPIN